MKIVITGTSSGIGRGLAKQLALDHHVVKLDRNVLDLTNINDVLNYSVMCDMLINCAGTGVGGKTNFESHSPSDVVTIFNTNLLAPVLLSQSALKNNPACKIVNITSTNNNRYWPGDLAYSLTKKALSDFGKMLLVECPTVPLLEVRLGLTKTNFNTARYRNNPSRLVDIYSSNKHLEVDTAVDRIVSVLFDNNVKFIEVSP